jgi:hypothetical protein
MASNLPNYREVYFEFKELTKIHGEPTFEALKTFSKELKANAQSVLSTLGGVHHGHLGLVLSPVAYSLISEVAYEIPAHPGQLVILPGTTQHVARNMTDVHTENMRVFREYHAVKKALIQQIVPKLDSIQESF